MSVANIANPPLSLPLDQGVQIAAREVSRLVEQLEASLTPGECSLLHRLRLAAESLGAIRATVHLRPHLP